MSDQDQDNPRRDFLRKSLTLIPVVTVASTGLGGSMLMATPEPAQAAPVQPAASEKAYEPTYFTAEEWARLSPKSTWRGLVLVAGAWGLIAAAGALFIVWPNPLTYVLAVMIIGARQLGLAILMHDAAHGALHSDQKINDWVGEWLCAAPVGGRLESYRAYHLKHHRFTEQPEDPDLGLSAPFPITRVSLRRKIIRDLTGQTFF